jgi:hypothetical protein
MCRHTFPPHCLNTTSLAAPRRSDVPGGPAWRKRTGLTDEATLDRRICAIRALVDFCKVQGARQRRRSPPSRDWGLTRDCEPSEAEAPKPRPIPQSCLNTQCIFCLGNLELPAESRFFCFCRPRKAREHLCLHRASTCRQLCVPFPPAPTDQRTATRWKT